MGSEAAIVRIAKTRDPSRWATNRISPDEQALWNGLGKTSNAEFVFDDLRVLVGNAGAADWLERGCDFLGALEELRKALYAGEITAHFVDENGKLNFHFERRLGRRPRGGHFTSRSGRFGSWLAPARPAENERR
jgi:hypothetical protein